MDLTEVEPQVLVISYSPYSLVQLIYIGYKEVDLKYQIKSNQIKELLHNRNHNHPKSVYKSIKIETMRQPIASKMLYLPALCCPRARLKNLLHLEFCSSNQNWTC